MIRKRITLNMFLMIFILSMVQAQNMQRPLSEVTIHHLNQFNEMLNSWRVEENRIDLKQEVYWPLGVNSLHFQIDMPVFMVYSSIDKPNLANLSDEAVSLAITDEAEMLVLPTPPDPLNYQDNLAPSVQITF